MARLYMAPDGEFYLRELVRLCGLAPRTVQLELDRLVAAGLAAVLPGALGTDGIAFAFVFGPMASGLATAGPRLPVVEEVVGVER